MTEFHCPSCGKMLTVPSGLSGKRGKCLSCGQILVVPPDDTVLSEASLQELLTGGFSLPEQPVEPDQDGDRYSCPLCRSPQTQRVSLVWEGGTSHVTSSSVGVGMAAFGDEVIPASTTISTRGTQQTALASRISPPARREHSFGIVLLIGFILSLLVLGLSSGVWDLPAATVAFLLLGPILFTIILEVLWRMSDVRYNQERWAPRYSRWKRLWICLRCGECFTPE